MHRYGIEFIASTRVFNLNEAYIHCKLFIYTFFRIRWGKDFNGKFYCCLHGFTLLHYYVNLRQSLIYFNLETSWHLLILNEIHIIGLCIQLLFFSRECYSLTVNVTFSLLRCSVHYIILYHLVWHTFSWYNTWYVISVIYQIVLKYYIKTELLWYIYLNICVQVQSITSWTSIAEHRRRYISWSTSLVADA